MILQRFDSCDFGRQNILSHRQFASPFALIFGGDRLGHDLNFRKSAAGNHLFQFFDRRSSRHSAGVHLFVGKDFLRQLLHDDNIGDTDASARLEHPEDFTVDAGFVGGKIDDAVGDDHIGGVVGNGQIFDFSQTKFHIAKAVFFGKAAGEGKHFVGHIDTDDLSAPAGQMGCQKAVEAGSTAEVYDHLARLYRNNAEGVPAPQSEVGFFGSKGDFLRGVADALLTAVLSREERMVSSLFKAMSE